MKKLFLFLAVAAFMIACKQTPPPAVETPATDEIVAVDETPADVVAEQPAAPAKPAAKPAAPKVETPKEEPKVEAPKEEPKKEEPKDEPKTNEVKKRR